MRTAYLALVMILLLAMAGASMAQMDQQRLQATAQKGPVVRAGLPSSGDVFIDGRFALRIPATAGGMSPMKRAQTIADRMNRAFAAGMSWENMRVSQVKGLWTASIDGTVIATADRNSARAYRISTGNLASRWARQTVVALGGQPQLIAAQLLPIPAAVAGAREELVPNWATSPTKTLPLLNATTGAAMGSVVVGGPSSRLELANAVACYEYSSDGATVRAFVPITGTSMTSPITRAHGVGVVSISADLMPTAELRTGTEVADMATKMASQWNTLINSKLAQLNLQSHAGTKVVPLYCMDSNQVIGAAQIVGTQRGVSQAKMVVAAMSDNMRNFSATATACPPMGTPTALNDVVVSALIYMPQPVEAPPCPLPPETPSPESEESEM